MQRNWNIIRKILIVVEQLPTEDSWINSTDIKEWANSYLSSSDETNQRILKHQ